MSAVWAVAGAAPSVIGRIGPNAITRVAEVLPGYVGLSMTRHLFERVGLAGYLAQLRCLERTELSVVGCLVARVPALVARSMAPRLGASRALGAGNSGSIAQNCCAQEQA